MELFENYTEKALAFFRVSAIAGFLTTTTLIINLQNQKFHLIFGKHARTFWWLFLISALILFIVILYIFNILFQKFNIGGYATLVVDFLKFKK